ncbi:MAG: hypothetical protein IT366_05440 [Candidatus Hydrogenedentes bacterium]|nr:hypothetical protein [Candidatus Hydrogenedentota bacterium]
MIGRTLFIVLVCACAMARTPEGMLGALRLPNNTRPAIVHAGESFAVEALRRGELKMTNDAAQYPLTPEWKEGADGLVYATAAVPTEAVPGAYALEWSEGDEGDQNLRSVYVLPATEPSNPFSRQYAVACVSVDLNDGDSKSAFAFIAEIDPAQVQFVVVFARGDEEKFSGALASLDACQAPTVVIINSMESIAQRWFGPRTFMMRYGPDAFLAPGLGADSLGDELGAAPETLARLRHDCKDARWVVGLFGGADRSIAMRNEITLNVDTAFHVRLYGAEPTESTEQAGAWAGWFEAPRNFALPANRVVIFAANRSKIAPAKPAPKSP